MSGFGAEDFALLEAMAAAGSEQPADLAGRTNALWAKVDRLVHGLGDALFEAGNYGASIWPDNDADERLPFIWARLKRSASESFSTHIGLFLSPAFCNLSIDLEKDPLEAGESAETLDQVIEFFRSRFPLMSSELGTTDLRVWTDTRNIVGTAGFAAIDFERFMADNHDAEHPWPKVGYILSARDVAGFADRWVEEYVARAAPLVPIYDAMISSFGRAGG